MPRGLDALGIRQADGTTQWRSGYLQSIQQLDADGGLARYRLKLVPGVWLATQARRNRIFQNKPILQVIEEVLAPYAPYVRWQIDTGVDTLLAELAPRPMIVQYQESDYTFITRLMAEEGLGWSVAESSPSGELPDFSAGAAHALHLFANGDSFTQDPSSAADGGIRWHQAGSQEDSDALFDWRHTRSLRSNQTATLSWAWAHKRALVAVESSSSRPAHVPDLERFSDAHDGRQLTNSDAQRYARLQQTQIDSSQWQIGCASSVRSLAVHSRVGYISNKKSLADARLFVLANVDLETAHTTHAAHITTAAHRHRRFVFRQLGHHAIGRQHQARDRRCILQRNACDFGRIKHAHRHHVTVFAVARVVAKVAFAFQHFVDDN